MTKIAKSLLDRRSLRARAASLSRLALCSGLNLLFPPRCAFCDTEGDELSNGTANAAALCLACRDALASTATSYCPRCGAIGPQAGAQATGTSCPYCREWPAALDGVIPLGSYEEHLREAVLRMKRASGEPLATAAATLYWQRRERALREVAADVVVPVPMHWLRRLARGTNSPEVVAQALAGRLAVPIEVRCLRRRRMTKPQSGLTPQQRISNVRRAFRLARGYVLGGARVLLVDDVLTTGATCREAARVLKRAGAGRVVVATLARTPSPA